MEVAAPVPAPELYRPWNLRLLALAGLLPLTACVAEVGPERSTRVDPDTLVGFQVDHAVREALAEEWILGVPSAGVMDEHLLALTSEPHHAGSEANEAMAGYFAERLWEHGFDEVRTYHYQALLPQPVHREVTLLEPEYVQLRLEEPPLEPDPDTAAPGVLPTFNAYSADGDVTAEVVYVNYGLPEDYVVLDELGVSVQGRIVLARYGRSWRGIKPRLAAEAGAVGVLLYSDPENDGYGRGPVLPEGRWRPEHGVQRGSVMDLPLYPGDPQTPFEPSVAGAERIPLDQAPTLLDIPVQPLSYGDAEPILSSLGGQPAPEDWQGGLPLDYHVGPGPAAVRLRLEFDWSIRRIVDVVGILHGTDEPDRIVMAGGHRDAWTFGGRDPSSGAAAMLETARVLGALAGVGHRPRRSIAIASWDGEEYGLVGSTEYGEEHAAELPGTVVAYLNRESYAAGPFRASGSHALQPLVNDVARVVHQPGEEGTSIHDAWSAAREDEVLQWAGESDVRLDAMGSGSDYAVFIDHLGIPSVNLRTGSGDGSYHSRYDTYWFFTTHGDPGFSYGPRLSELTALFLLRLANADILPFDLHCTAEAVGGYLDEVETLAGAEGVVLDLAGARERLDELELAGERLAEERDRIVQMPEEQLEARRAELWELNEQILWFENGFLHPEGLPGRPWYRHTLYAPGYDTGYRAKTLPGIREAVEGRDAAEAADMVTALEQALERARDTTNRAAEVAEGI